MKVQKAAAKAGADPKAFCDKGADIFRVHNTTPRLWDRLRLTPHRTLHERQKFRTTTSYGRQTKTTRMSYNMLGYGNKTCDGCRHGRLMLDSICYKRRVSSMSRSTKAGTRSPTSASTHSHKFSPGSSRRQGGRPWYSSNRCHLRRLADMTADIH